MSAGRLKTAGLPVEGQRQAEPAEGIPEWNVSVMDLCPGLSRPRDHLRDLVPADRVANGDPGCSGQPGLGSKCHRDRAKGHDEAPARASASLRQRPTRAPRREEVLVADHRRCSLAAEPRLPVPHDPDHHPCMTPTDHLASRGPAKTEPEPYLLQIKASGQRTGLHIRTTLVRRTASLAVSRVEFSAPPLRQWFLHQVPGGRANVMTMTMRTMSTSQYGQCVVEGLRATKTGQWRR